MDDEATATGEPDGEVDVQAAVARGRSPAGPPPPWADLPANVVLHVFSLAPDCKTAAAWKFACTSFAAVCGRVDMLQLRVVGDDRAAADALDASSGSMATWFGLDLDFAPMELAQQVGGLSMGWWVWWGGSEGTLPACPKLSCCCRSEADIRPPFPAPPPSQGARITSPFVLRAKEAKLVERVVKVR